MSNFNSFFQIPGECYDLSDECGKAHLSVPVSIPEPSIVN